MVEPRAQKYYYTLIQGERRYPDDFDTFIVRTEEPLQILLGMGVPFNFVKIDAGTLCEVERFELKERDPLIEKILRASFPFPFQMFKGFVMELSKAEIESVYEGFMRRNRRREEEAKNFFGLS